MMADWWPDWTGETVVIVASGPSAKGVDLAPARGRARFMATNTSWLLAPWADILHACDYAWWREHKGCPAFEGLKTTVDRVAPVYYPDVKLIGCRRGDDRLILDQKGVVGWGGNSGFHCINLAAQFGVSKIILVGFDMSIAAGLHWHGKHPGTMNNPSAKNVERWRRAVDGAAGALADRGIKAFNCSSISALRNYRKTTLEEALAA